jgi:OOP family OmpA-OmpF porin
MNSFTRMAGAFLMLLVLSFGVAADDVDNPWHVSLSGGYVNFDSARPVSNDVLVGFGFGKFMGSNFSIDLEYDSISTNMPRGMIDEVFPGATYDKWNLDTTSVVGRLYFGDSSMRPFVAGGVTYTDHTNIFDQGGDVGFEFGAGVDGNFNDRMSARFQVLYRQDRDGDSIPSEASFDDLIITAGLVFRFGGSTEPPPPPPDPDSDGDGVPDSRDKCPNTPRGTAVDDYGCPLDSDGDGVLNGRDKCPDTRAGAVVDLDGCEVEEVIELKGVNFEFDSADLTDDSISSLDQAVAILRKHPDVRFEVGGHTDSMGKDDYNQGLSERRAQSVLAYLVAQGIDASRMTSVGFGESKPVASNDTEKGRAKNRRTELVVKKD